MRLLKDLEQTDPMEIGRELHRFAAELYPLCRSITGDGLRQTLALIQHRIPLQIVEVPSNRLETLPIASPFGKVGLS